MREVRFTKLISSIRYGTFSPGQEKAVPDEFAAHCLEIGAAVPLTPAKAARPKKRHTIKRRSDNVERKSDADGSAD